MRPMRELLNGLVPGPAGGGAGRHRRSRRGHAALRRRDGARAPRRRRSSATATSTSRSATCRTSPCRTRCARSSPRGWMRSSRGPDAAPGRLGPRPGLLAPMRWPRSPASTRRTSSRGCAPWSGASCSTSRRPALAGARAVSSSSSRSSARSPTARSRGATAARGTWPWRATTRASATTSWRARWPATTLRRARPPTRAPRPMPSAAQARLALTGAADRAAALGGYDQAVAYLDQALADHHRSGRARAAAGSRGTLASVGRAPGRGSTTRRRPLPPIASWATGSAARGHRPARQDCSSKAARCSGRRRCSRPRYREAEAIGDEPVLAADAREPLPRLHARRSRRLNRWMPRTAP